jgi:hypothetical protein
LAGALRPLHDGDTVTRHQVFEPQEVVLLNRVDPVQVDVVERDRSRILRDDRISRAGNRFGDAERGAEGLRKDRLARAERSVKRDDAAARQVRGKTCGEVFGFGGGCRDGRQGSSPAASRSAT